MASINKYKNMADNFFRKGPHAAKNKVADANAVPSSDERKTVILDEQLEGVEFDDKVWLYWTRNKKSIVSSVVLAFAIIIGVNSWKLYKASAEQSRADAFEKASTPAQLADFAKQYSGSKLAGVALLQNADAAYKDGKFAEAKSLYADAKKDLKGTILLGKALLGEAVSACETDKAAGEILLKAAFEDSKIDAVYRAQAGYLYGTVLEQKGDKQSAKKVFETVSLDAQGGYFARLAGAALARL